MDRDNASSPLWRELAAQASNERDPARLTTLLEQLIKAFDEDLTRQKLQRIQLASFPKSHKNQSA